MDVFLGVQSEELAELRREVKSLTKPFSQNGYGPENIHVERIVITSFQLVQIWCQPLSQNLENFLMVAVSPTKREKDRREIVMAVDSLDNWRY